MLAYWPASLMPDTHEVLPEPGRVSIRNRFEPDADGVLRTSHDFSLGSDWLRVGAEHELERELRVVAESRMIAEQRACFAEIDRMGPFIRPLCVLFAWTDDSCTRDEPDALVPSSIRYLDPVRNGDVQVWRACTNGDAKPDGGTELVENGVSRGAVDQ